MTIGDVEYREGFAQSTACLSKSKLVHKLRRRGVCLSGSKTMSQSNDASLWGSKAAFLLCPF